MRTEQLTERTNLKNKIQRGTKINARLKHDLDEIISQTDQAVAAHNEFVNLIIQIMRRGDIIEFDDLKTNYRKRIFKIASINRKSDGHLSLTREIIDVSCLTHHQLEAVR